MALIYSPGGAITPLNPPKGHKTLTLTQLQAAVGGHIEIVESRDKGHFLVVNEEGKLEGLEPNDRATALFYFPEYDTLHGNVVLAGKDEIE